MLRLNKGLGTSGSDFCEVGDHEKRREVNSLEEMVGTGYRVIDDCTSLDEEVQHNRAPLGDMHPLRGTGSV